MKSTKVAARYAKALLELAIEQKNVDSNTVHVTKEKEKETTKPEKEKKSGVCLLL